MLCCSHTLLRPSLSAFSSGGFFASLNVFGFCFGLFFFTNMHRSCPLCHEDSLTPQDLAAASLGSSSASQGSKPGARGSRTTALRGYLEGLHSLLKCLLMSVLTSFSHSISIQSGTGRVPAGLLTTALSPHTGFQGRYGSSSQLMMEHRHSEYSLHTQPSAGGNPFLAAPTQGCFLVSAPGQEGWVALLTPQCGHAGC